MAINLRQKALITTEHLLLKIWFMLIDNKLVKGSLKLVPTSFVVPRVLDTTARPWREPFSTDSFPGYLRVMYPSKPPCQTLLISSRILNEVRAMLSYTRLPSMWPGYDAWTTPGVCGFSFGLREDFIGVLRFFSLVIKTEHFI